MLRKFLYSLIASIWVLSSCSTVDEFSSDPYKNYDQLWETLDKNYCYFDLKLPRGVTWRDLYHKHRVHLRPNMSSDSLFLIMTQLLSELKDGHVNLATPFDYGIGVGNQISLGDTTRSLSRITSVTTIVSQGLCSTQGYRRMGT